MGSISDFSCSGAVRQSCTGPSSSPRHPIMRRTAPRPPRRAGEGGGEGSHETTACCRALTLQLLPAASAPSRSGISVSRARVSFVPRRRSDSSVRCCADQEEPPQDAVLKAISREHPPSLSKPPYPNLVPTFPPINKC
jgi:hypothetical protein